MREANPRDPNDWPGGEIPDQSIFSNRIQMWSLENPDNSTVAAASKHFGVPGPDIIRGVEGHHWMYLDGFRIEHDGE